MFTTAVVVSYASAFRSTIKQQWLSNLSNTCGIEFETDKEGTFIISNKFASFFDDAIPPTAALAGPLGLYLGMLAFRCNGYGRFSKKAFSSRTGIVRVLYAICIYSLLCIPEKFNSLLFNENKMNFWNETILKIAIPQFIIMFLVTFFLPLVTKSAFSYPYLKQDEEVHAFLASDIELAIQHSSNKVNQINGKSLNYLYLSSINNRLF